MSNIELINDLVSKQEFEQAENVILNSFDNNKNDVEFLKLAGLTFVNLAKYEQAKSCFETVVKYIQDDATSWFYLGNCYENLGELSFAKNAYIKVIELRPEYADAYQNLSLISLKLNELDNVIEYAELGNKYAEANYIFDFIIGTVYLKMKQYDKSVVFLKSAINKEPDNYNNLNTLGTVYVANRQFDEAIEVYKKALELSADNPMAYYNIGSVYQVQNEHILAIEYFKKAVDLDDEDEVFKISLALSLTKSEQFSEAIDIYKSLVLQHPEKDNYKYNLGICYEAIGDIKTAISYLEIIAHNNPKFILPAQKLATYYIRINNLSKAKELYDNILLKNNPTAEILHQYAVLSSNLCDTSTAERILKKALNINPNMHKAHKDLGIIYLNKRLFDYAEEEFKIALELAPNDFENIFEYGNYLYSISKNKEADVYYQKALDIEPKNVLALTFMGLNKMILNQLDAAKDYVMQAIEINPHHEYIQFCVGRILYARKEYEDAKKYLIKSVEQNQDIETQNTLALVYYELGEYESAIKIFENLLEKNKDNISLLLQLAKCYEKSQNNDKALEYLDRLTNVFPEHEEALELIRALS